MGYKDLIDENSVILVGNGLNLRGSNNNSISWESILKNMNKNKGNGDVPKGYPLTEFFEIVNIDKDDQVGMINEFIDSIKSIEPGRAHHDLVKTCMDKGINILTTNFDHSIEKAGNFDEGAYRKLDEGFTDYYPWQRYYSNGPKAGGIKIWHVNGDVKYRRSIKLSVCDYAGCISYYGEFDPMAKSRYKRDRTWINEIMEKNLIIMGLTLSEAEIFLRHVLIRRASYSKKRGKGLKGYFLTTEDFETVKNSRLKFFLESVDIKIEYFKDYNEMYDVYPW